METQTRLSRHNKFISAKNIIAIFSVSSDDSLHAPSCRRVAIVVIYIYYSCTRIHSYVNTHIHTLICV